MFIFGHLGFGETLATPWRARLSNLALLAGALLPDVIDKPLFYLHLFPYITGTRAFGHTGIFLLLIAAYALVRRSRTAAALALGMATHLLVDGALEGFTLTGSAAPAIAWPLLGPFYDVGDRTLVTHLEGLWAGPIVTAELVGLALLLWHRRGLTSAAPAQSN